MLYPQLNGLRIRINYINGDKTYFVDEGKARHITTVDIYNAMFRDWDGIWTITFPADQMIDFGTDIKDLIPIFHWGPDIYLSGKIDRRIADIRTMEYCHFNGPGPQPTAEPRQRGKDIAFIPKLNGNRVKESGTEAIYLIDCGVKRHIKDMSTYVSLFGGTDRTYVVDSLSDVPTGRDIESKYNRLVTPSDTPNKDIYFLENGEKRLIRDSNTMSYYGFDQGSVTKMSWMTLFEIPSGLPLEWPFENGGIK